MFEKFIESPSLANLLEDVSTVPTSMHPSGFLSGLYEAQAGVWEGYTIAEHTFRVFKALEYLGGEPRLDIFDVRDEKLVLLLHDGAKSLGTPTEQAQHNLALLEELYRAGYLQISERKYEIFKFLVGEEVSIYGSLFRAFYCNRPVGYCPNMGVLSYEELRNNPGYRLDKQLPAEFVLQYVSQLVVGLEDGDPAVVIDAFAESVKKAADDLNVSSSDLLDLIVRKFQVDVLAYTNLWEVDGVYGLLSLDYVFKLQRREDNCNALCPVIKPEANRYEFAPGLEELFCEVEARMVS